MSIVRAFFYSDDPTAPISKGKDRHLLTLGNGILGRNPKKPIKGRNEFAVCVDVENGKVYASLHLLRDEITSNKADVWGPGTSTQYSQYEAKCLIGRTLVCSKSALPKLSGHPSSDNGPVIKFVYERLKQVA